MKKLIAIVIIAIVALSAIACGKPEAKKNDFYPVTAVVVSVWYDDDVVTVMDCNGFVWEFYGTEGWQVGDTCSMIMDDNGTVEVEDDTIVTMQYSSFTVEGFAW